VQNKFILLTATCSPTIQTEHCCVPTGKTVMQTLRFAHTAYLVNTSVQTSTSL